MVTEKKAFPRREGTPPRLSDVRFLPLDSRLWRLAALLERRMPLYFPPGCASSRKAERRVVFSVASEVLSDTADYKEKRA